MRFLNRISSVLGQSLPLVAALALACALIGQTLARADTFEWKAEGGGKASPPPTQ